jgi:hypothetical protein
VEASVPALPYAEENFDLVQVIEADNPFVFTHQVAEHGERFSAMTSLHPC